MAETWTVRSNELSHYGVLGMKWGVRKDRDSKSSGQKSGGLIEMITGKKPDEKVKVNVGTATINPYDKADSKHYDQVISLINEENPDRYATTDEANRLLDNLESNRWTMAYTRDKDQVALTNHDAPSQIRTVNCFECTLAYEMRNRGYNVQSKEMNGGWTAEVKRCFDIKDCFTVSIDLDRNNSGNYASAGRAAYDVVAEKCIAYGEGARGYLGVDWVEGSGHAMYWVIEDGNFKIIDAQDSNRTGTDYYSVFEHVNAVDSIVDIVRLDNAELLPGIVDYVENYSAVTDKEREEAAKKKHKPTLNEVQKENELKNALSKKKDASSAIKNQEKAFVELGKSTFDRIVSKVTNTTKNLIDKGREVVSNFLSNPLNIHDSEPVYDHGTGGFMKKR